LAVETLEDRFCPSGDYLLVTSFDTDNVLRYEAGTGVFVDEFVRHKSGGLNQPAGVIFGPHDDNLYVSSGYYGGPGQLRGVLRYNGTTGQFIDEFTEPGHLEKVNQPLFGPDGNGDGRQDLYVANGREGTTGGIVRFDGITGAFIDDFVPNGSGGLRSPGLMVFGPSPDDPSRLDLYVPSAFNGNVLRFHGTTGAFLGEFLAPGTGGMDQPIALTFGPDGNLYVTSSGFTWPSGVGGNAAVLRFQGPAGDAPGAYIDTFVPKGSGGLLDVSAVLFGPDGNGDGNQDLYVSSLQLSGSYQTKEHTSSVKRFDGVTGAFIDTLVGIDSGGLDGPWAMTFTRTDPTTLAYLGGERQLGATLPVTATTHTLSDGMASPLLIEALARWQATGTDIHITNLGGTTLGLAAGSTIWLDDNAPRWGWFVDPTPGNDSEFTTPGETTKTITIEVKGDSKKEANETFYLDLLGLSSNSLFTKNRGLGTILNDD
jgi:DNA-binding beta-propeller fold protein YncE